MALEVALEQLVTEMGSFCTFLDQDLDVNAGDFPEPEGIHLAVQVSESITELAGRCKAALSLALQARSAGRYFDPNNLRRSLAESQREFQSLSRDLLTKLLSYERIAEIRQLGREREQWLGWVSSVWQGLDKCRPLVGAVEDAYLSCWQEIAERVSATPVSMNTTNIGQQITTESLVSREAGSQGIT